MKRNLCIAMAVLAVLCCLPGCAQVEKADDKMKNSIEPKALTTDQQDIVTLLSSEKQDILLFDYKTADAYKSVEVWAEVYQDGVLIDRPSGANMYGDEAKARDGEIAVLISQIPGFSWSFVLSEDGTRVSHASEPSDIDYGALGRGYGPISGPVAIESGKEIVLYASIFSSGAISTQGDLQMYVEQPELLNGYPYVHIIKCKFEK